MVGTDPPDDAIRRCLVMDCGKFRRKHDAFIDDTLSGVEMEDMRGHLRACPRCATTNHDVHRALLVARNLPRLQVSGDFQDRLRARIERERVAPVGSLTVSRRSYAVRGMALTAAVVLALGSARSFLQRPTGPDRLPAVIASAPPAPMFVGDDPAPAFMASMSTGIPMWPALMLAEEGPLMYAAEASDAGQDLRAR